MAGNQMQLEDWLDDLCVRFIINLPEEDLSSVARICFQVEEAQWFYEDFIRPLDPSLPSLSLRTFCLRIFKHCPLLASFSVENHIQAFEEFLQYKTRVPVRGAIMLNPAMDSVVLVKGWKKGANWSFPRGKINKDEDDLDCAIREVYEETGLDLRQAGLVPTEAKPKYIEIAMREQHLRLYVFRDVPMDTNFQPRTRKEISKIEWYKLSELPTLRKKGSQNHQQYDSSGPGNNANKFYMVAPFLNPLKKWINSQKKAAAKKMASEQYLHPVNPNLPIEEEPTEDEAWNTENPVEPPTIDSLDGATRELQRLLNVQPRNEAPPPPPPPPSENKASALLSLLQPAAGRPPQPQPQPPSQIPFASTDFTAPGVGQPPNAQYQTNYAPSGPADAHQPPPPDAALPWNHPQNPPQGHAGPTASQVYSGHPNYTISPSYPGYIGVPSNYAPGAAPSLPSQQPQAPAFQGGLLRAISAQPPPGQALSHAQPSQSVSRQAPLNGQALTLLNAFKQGAAPSASNEPKQDRQVQQPGTSHPVGQQFSSPYSQYIVPQVPSSIRATQSPSELAGSSVHPPRQDQHKSALLDLFKKQTTEAPADVKSTQVAAVEPPIVSAKVSAEKGLLAQLQGTTLAGPADEQRPQAHPENQDRITVQKRDKRTPNPKKNSPRASRNTKPAAPQPTRILQRGQSLQSLDQPPNVTKFSASMQLPRSRPSTLPPPPQMFKQDASQEQKRQLLSLFGTVPAGPQDTRREPSRAGSLAGDATISKADQSFLLGYLQSVTNNAGR